MMHPGYTQHDFEGLAKCDSETKPTHRECERLGSCRISSRMHGGGHFCAHGGAGFPDRHARNSSLRIGCVGRPARPVFCLEAYDD